MIFPYRDDSPSRVFPAVTLAIILINGWVFIQEIRMRWSDQSSVNNFVGHYGLMPAKATRISDIASIKAVGLSLLTFMFLHANLWHFVGNMWFLWLFGDNVEARLGRLRFLIFYLLCGMVGGVAHVALSWGSKTVCIGASGAVAGVMGAYIMLFPKARIRTLILIVVVPLFVSVPAWAYIGLWFASQLYRGLGQVAAASDIAWWAHIGGFISGIWLQGELKPERRPAQRYASGQAR